MLLTLLGAAVITLVLAVLLGGMAIWFHLLADLLVVLYVGLLVQIRRSEAERSAKVRYLPATRRSPGAGRRPPRPPPGVAIPRRGGTAGQRVGGPDGESTTAPAVRPGQSSVPATPRCGVRPRSTRISSPA